MFMLNEIIKERNYLKLRQKLMKTERTENWFHYNCIFSTMQNTGEVPHDLTPGGYLYLRQYFVAWWSREPKNAVELSLSLYSLSLHTYTHKTVEAINTDEDK